MAQIIEVTNPFEPFKDTRKYSHAGGLTIREWLEQTYPGFKEFARPTVCLVNGNPLMRSEWFVYILKPDDVINFVVIPGDPVTLLYILYAVIIVALVVLVLTMPKPALPGELPEPDPVYGLQGQRNQNRLSHPIESPYGRCRLFPSYASRSYNTYEGNQQFQYSLYSLGQGEYDIESIQYEDTAIANFADVVYEVYPPGVPATMFPDNVVTSTEVGGIELFGPNESGFAVVGPFSANEPGTVTDLLQVDVVFPVGLYHGKDDGTLARAEIDLLFEYREIDNSGDPVGMGTWLTMILFTQGMATTTQQRFTLQLPVSAARYEVRAQRTNNKQTSTSWGNTARWDALRAFLPSTKDYGQVTLIAVKARATNNLNDQSAQRFNVWATRKLRIYDLDTETWSALTATRNPIWAFCDVFQARYGGQLEDRFLDLPGLCALAEDFADENRNFDFVFDSRITVWEAGRTIGRVGRCVPMLNGSQVTLVRTEPKTVPTAVFTQDNIVEGSFSWEIKLANVGDFDGVEIEYIDPVSWKPETVTCSIGDDPEEPDNPEQIKLPGCTDRDQAFQEGMFIRSSKLLLRENISFSTGLEGHIPTYGDLILISHDLPRWGKAGLVKSIVGTTVTLSEPVEFGVGTFVIGFRKKDSSLSGPHECTVGSTPFEVILGGALSDSLFFDNIHELPMFLFGSIETFAKKCTVVSLQPSDDHTVQVDAIVYNAAIFDHDEDTAPAPGNGSTPATPTVPALNCDHLVATWEPMQDGKVRVSWGTAIAARSYRVDLTNDGTNWVTAGETNDTWLLVDAIPGQDFQFRVTPLGLASIVGETCISPFVTAFKPDFSPPPPPGGQPTYPDYWPRDILLPVGATVSIECKIRGGTASLIGYDPFVTPSGLPVKYRTYTMSGVFTSSAYLSGDCSGSVAGTLVTTISGNANYDADTGEFTDSTTAVEVSTPGSTSTISPVSKISGCPSDACKVDWTCDETTAVGVGTSACCSLGLGTEIFTGTHTHTLSNLDTDEKAETRLEFSLDPWEEISWGSCTGVSSVWEIRTSGVSHVKSNAKAKFTGSAYYTDWDYVLTVNFEQKLLPSGSWEDSTTITYKVPSDGSGDFEYIIDLPITEGYETRIKNWSLYL